MKKLIQGGTPLSRVTRFGDPIAYGGKAGSKDPRLMAEDTLLGSGNLYGSDVNVYKDPSIGLWERTLSYMTRYGSGSANSINGFGFSCLAFPFSSDVFLKATIRQAFDSSQLSGCITGLILKASFEIEGDNPDNSLFARVDIFNNDIQVIERVSGVNNTIIQFSYPFSSSGFHDIEFSAIAGVVRIRFKTDDYIFEEPYNTDLDAYVRHGVCGSRNASGYQGLMQSVEMYAIPTLENLPS